MSPEIAAGTLALIIFSVFVYVIHMKMKKGSWPKVRNPFYYN